MRGARFVAWTIFTLVAGVTVAGAPCTWESALQIEIDHASAHFGEAISAGDVDGDGYNDVVVGAHGFINDNGWRGRAYLFPGSAEGMSAEPTWIVEATTPGTSFGSGVAVAGDINGDGFDDVVVGDRTFDGRFFDSGALFVYFGSAGGLPSTPSAMVEGIAHQVRIGGRLAFAGDVDGDGHDDIITSAGFGDVVYLYRGSPSGLSSTPDWEFDGGTLFGWSIASAGDVNADGYDDVIVGSPYQGASPPGEGLAFVFHGSAEGLSLVPNWAGESNQPWAFFGESVGSAGDVNADGYDDVVIGAPENLRPFSGLPQAPEGVPNGPGVDGFAFVYLGSPDGLEPDPVWRVAGVTPGVNLGRSVASPGDVDGDGFDEIVVAALGFVNVYRGSPDGPSRRPGCLQPVEGSSPLVVPAGDLDLDGYGDFLVGAYRYSNGESQEGTALFYSGASTHHGSD